MRKTDPTTSHINTFSRVLSKLFSQGINFEEEVKSLALLWRLPTSWEVFCAAFANNCSKLNLYETIGQDWWNSLSMNRQKPTTRSSRSIGSTLWENKTRESVETRINRDIGKADSSQNRGIVDQVSFAHTTKRPVTRFLIVGWSRRRRTVDDLSRTRDDPTRIVLPKATKSTLLTPDPEKSSQ